MAMFSLNIYGNDDEIVKTYSTNKVRWGVFMQAIEMQEGLEEKTPAEQLSMVSMFMKKLFPEITDAELECADMGDVFNTFKQIVNKANQIGAGNSKNGKGAV